MRVLPVSIPKPKVLRSEEKKHESSLSQKSRPMEIRKGRLYDEKAAFPYLKLKEFVLNLFK